MNIEIANIVLTSTIVVLVMSYGVWLRNVVNQQVRTKDSTIEQLGAAIRANGAEISRLKADAAPAIAGAYMQLKEYSEKVTQELNAEVAKAKSTKGNPKELARALLERDLGFKMASNIWFEGFRRLQFNLRPRAVLTTEDYLDAMDMVSKESQAWRSANQDARRKLESDSDSVPI